MIRFAGSVTNVYTGSILALKVTTRCFTLLGSRQVTVPTRCISPSIVGVEKSLVEVNGTMPRDVEKNKNKNQNKSQNKKK